VPANRSPAFGVTARGAAFAEIFRTIYTSIGVDLIGSASPAPCRLSETKEAALNWLRSIALMLVLATPTTMAAAADSPCFELYPNGSGAEGSILLNRCSGESWLLVGVNSGSGSSLGWHPIPIDMASEGAGDPAKDDDGGKSDGNADTDAAHAY